MTELPEDFKSNDSSPPRDGLVVDHAYVERLRELKLELEKTRSQASAARLDARAAELELRIQRLGGRIEESENSLSAGNSTSGERIELRLDQPEQRDRAAEPMLNQEQRAQHEAASESYYAPSLPRHRPRRSAQVFRRVAERNVRLDAAHEVAIKPGHPEDQDCVARSDQLIKGISAEEASPIRIESWDDFRSIIGHDSPSPASEVASSPGHRRNAPRQKDSPSRAISKAPRERNSSSALPRIGRQVHQKPRLSKNIDLATDHDQQGERRRKPGAWLLSAAFHVLILIFLAFFTLSSSPPGDQIAIAGSVAETDEMEIESLAIETVEMQPTPSEPTPSEIEYEISDIGEIAITEMIPDAPPALPSPLVDSMMQNQALSSASMSLKSESDAKIKFCGVEGGGNHFVYLVDSSGSMGSAFESARTELLRSIEILKPQQRFYVIFFDTESDYMRLSSPDKDEPRSAYASQENKRALRQWAMTISMDRGRAPYDALPFAIDLDPDVIFLLSDGEFPQKIEDLLKEINRVDNLFGDEGPISIVHTIGYHSREGESRMRRIAKQNGGQYRHVPKP